MNQFSHHYAISIKRCSTPRMNSRFRQTQASKNPQPIIKIPSLPLSPPYLPIPHTSTKPPQILNPPSKMSSLLTTLSDHVRTTYPCLTFFFGACAFFVKSTAFLLNFDRCWKEVLSIAFIISIFAITVLVIILLCLCLCIEKKKRGKRVLMEGPMVPVVEVDEDMRTGNYKYPTVEE